jgi:hypothetical protein
MDLLFLCSSDSCGSKTDTNPLRPNQGGIKFFSAWLNFRQVYLLAPDLLFHRVHTELYGVEIINVYSVLLRCASSLTQRCLSQGCGKCHHERSSPNLPLSVRV